MMKTAPDIVESAGQCPETQACAGFRWAEDQAGGSTLSSGVCWTFAAYVVFGCCQWALIILLARMGTAELVGLFALGLAVATPVSLIAGLSLRTIVITCQQGEYCFGNFITVRIITAGLTLITVGFICGALQYEAQAVLVILAVTLLRLAEGFGDTLYGLWQRHDRLRQIAISTIMSGLSYVFALGAIMALTGNLVLAVLGMLASRLVLLLSYDSSTSNPLLAGSGQKLNPSRRLPGNLPVFKPQWDGARQLRMVRLALPLGAVGGLNALCSNLPRLILERFEGQAELGVFTVVSYLPMVVMTLVLAVGQAAFGRLARCHRAGDRRGFSMLLGQLLLVSGGLCAAGIGAVLLAGRESLSVLYSGRYAHYEDLLLIMMIGVSVGCLASCIGVAITAASRFKEQVPLNAAGAFAAALVSWTLIPVYGVDGAAYAYLACMLVQLIGTLWILGASVYAGWRSDGLNQHGAAGTLSHCLTEGGRTGAGLERGGPTVNSRG